MSKNTIDLKQVYPFNWDYIYIIQPSLYPEDIGKIIGTSCDCKIVPDGQRLFIFVREQKVVQKSYVECKGFIFIGQDDPKGFFKIESTASVFKIDRQEDGFYLLHPSIEL